MSEITTFTPPNSLNTAVLFLVFNRLDTTKQVFEAIRQAKPPRLYIAADGARSSKVGEAAKVTAVRDFILSNIDWDCDVNTLFPDENLGCKVAVSEAISWFFENEEMGIILEDDCLPSQSFFWFCEELLQFYRDDERIAMISGDNFQFGRKRGDASYYFSRYLHIWGWASWRRSWQHYDRNADVWPEIRDHRWIDVLITTASERKFWAEKFQLVYEKKIDTWDYQWVLSCWSQGMLSIIPSVNLISNIGFGLDATHTHGVSVYADMSVDSIDFPLIHPDVILPNKEADRFTSKGMFTSNLFRRIISKIKASILSKLRS